MLKRDGYKVIDDKSTYILYAQDNYGLEIESFSDVSELVRYVIDHSYAQDNYGLEKVEQCINEPVGKRYDVTAIVLKMVEMLKERDAEMQRKKEQKSDKQMKAKINKMLYETESTIDNDEWIEVQENAIDGARITAGNGTAIRSCQLNNGQLTALRNAINEYLVDKFVERNNK